MKVYLDDRLLADTEARIDPRDRGLTLGDGLYETIAVRGGRPARVSAHLARLRRGAAVVGIDLAKDDQALVAALAEVARANDIDEGALRLTLTRGPAPHGLAPPAKATPTLLIVGRSEKLAPAPLATAIVATVTRRNERSPISRIKTTNCLDAVLALREALERGADDALLLNGAGNVAEATTANLFAVIDGRLVTPPVADGALAGVMRADVIEGLDAEERSIAPKDLGRASEAFLTSSLRVRPLVAVDGRAIGNGRPGPFTARAQRIV